MVTAQVGRADDPVSPVAARLTETDTLEDDLRELAREHLALVMRQMFNWLVLPMPVNKAMAVVGNHPLYTRAQLDGYADEGVRIVLAAYGS